MLSKFFIHYHCYLFVPCKTIAFGWNYKSNITFSFSNYFNADTIFSTYLKKMIQQAWKLHWHGQPILLIALLFWKMSTAYLSFFCVWIIWLSCLCFPLIWTQNIFIHMTLMYPGGFGTRQPVQDPKFLSQINEKLNMLN